MDVGQEKTDCDNHDLNGPKTHITPFFPDNMFFGFGLKNYRTDHAESNNIKI